MSLSVTPATSGHSLSGQGGRPNKRGSCSTIRIRPTAEMKPASVGVDSTESMNPNRSRPSTVVNVPTARAKPNRIENGEADSVLRFHP